MVKIDVNDLTLLRNKVEPAVQSHSQNPGIQRLEWEIQPLDPLRWLGAQDLATKIYWADRDHKTEAAGVGHALRVYGWNRQSLQDHLLQAVATVNKDERLRLYGGLAFCEQPQKDQVWIPFGAYHFYLPMYELVRRGDRYFFACNCFAGAYGSAEKSLAHYLQSLNQLQPLNGRTRALPRFIDRSDHPTRHEWLQQITTALAAFRSSTLEKVVLARKSALIFNNPVKAEELLERLRAVNPNSFLFLFQPDRHSAFIGSTPERLYRREEQHLQTEAVAGTRARGETPALDKKLKQDLLNCEKDRREHQYVVSSIEQVLKPYSEKIVKDSQVGILENARVQHLIRRFRVELKSGVSDYQLLNTLHPTPAVGGVPRTQALEAIHTIEPFSRGWYAGPIGWFNARGAEFAVAIRSALVQREKVTLFAGAGIVQGSQPEAEWNELENKIASYIKILQAE